MRIRYLLSSLVFISVFSCNLRAQEDEKKPDFNKFVKLNIDFRKYDPKNYYFDNWQPAFVWISKKTFHEVGLSNLSFSKDQPIDGYLIRGFDAGVRYLYKRRLTNKFSALNPHIGLSFQGDYYASHAEPVKPDIHKEFYLKMFTCILAANASLSYVISNRLAIDLDFPFPVWRARFYRQRDILPVTKDRRILSDQEFDYPPKYYFNFRTGIRYRID